MGVWCSCPMLRLTRNANQTTPSPNPHSTNHTLLSIHLSTNSLAPSYSVGKTKATLKSQFPATCSEKSFLLDTVVSTCLTGENTPLIFLVRLAPNPKKKNQACLQVLRPAATSKTVFQNYLKIVERSIRWLWAAVVSGGGGTTGSFGGE